MISDPIHCPSCKQTNPANSNFCNVCGAALPSVPCPQCGEMNDVGTAMQCRHCGGALLDDGLGNLELGLKVIEAAMAAATPQGRMRRAQAPSPDPVPLTLPVTPPGTPVEVRLADLPVLWPPLPEEAGDDLASAPLEAAESPSAEAAESSSWEVPVSVVPWPHRRKTMIVATLVLAAALAFGYRAWRARPAPPPAPAAALVVPSLDAAGTVAAAPAPADSPSPPASAPVPAAAEPDARPAAPRSTAPCSEAVAALGLCPPLAKP